MPHKQGNWQSLFFASRASKRWRASSTGRVGIAVGVGVRVAVAVEEGASVGVAVFAAIVIVTCTVGVSGIRIGVFWIVG